MTSNKTLEQNINNVLHYEEYDESMMPENLPHEIK